MRLKAASAAKKPSMMYLAQKTADSTTSYGKTVVESGRKIKSYSMSRLGGPIMLCFTAECCIIWHGGQEIQHAPISSARRLAPDEDAEFVLPCTYNVCKIEKSETSPKRVATLSPLPYASHQDYRRRPLRG